VKDGSEIHESVLTLLSVVKAGAEPLFFAPAASQARVVNHLTGEVESGAERNMLIESARIARGNVKDIRELQAASADALFFPGGYGAAYNIFTYAENGTNCTVHPEVERVINQFYAAKKPIGFICISPVMAAKILGKFGIEVTAGNDPVTAEAITTFGAKHIERRADEIHIDRQNRIVTTPAYMLAKNVAEAEAGISKLVTAVLSLA
jgi:enhancing lycopene biosynthesis protein 2